MDAERREWLETLTAACARILARSEEEGHDDPGYRAVMDDVADLFARLKVELNEGLGPDTPPGDAGPA